MSSRKFSPGLEYKIASQIIPSSPLTSPVDNSLLKSSAPTTLAPDAPPVLNVSGTTNYTNGAGAKTIAAGLAIADPDGGNLDGALVVITSNFDASQDSLGIAGQTGNSGSISGLNWNYNSNTGVLTVSGTAANDVYQNVLRSVTYSNSSNTPTQTPRSIQFSLGSNLASSDNQHFYEFVSEPGVSWTSAQAAAAGRNYFGLQGYLATITSATEQSFIQGKVQGNGWIGGSDAASEGDWRWVTGPEANTPFWSGNASGSAVGNQYTNWNTGEPNNRISIEHYAHVIGNSSAGPVGTWNDLPDGGDTGFYQPQGYIVEYGGLAVDPTLQITGNVTVTLNALGAAASTTPDFNGDNNPDILWRNYGSGENGIWEMKGTTFDKPVLLTKVEDTDWKIQGAADFNGDNKTEILWRNYRTGENGIWLVNGSTLEQSILLPKVDDTKWQIQGVADFNGDGKTDILWRNYGTGENAVWQMNDTTLEQSILLTKVEDTNWKIQGVADFNGDGKTDILWRNYGSGENGIWQMNGTTFDQGILLPKVDDTKWEVAALADFNGDGKTDVIWRNYGTGENGIWQLNGTTFEAAQAISLTKVEDTKWKIEGVQDYNGDGQPDLLWRNYGSDETGIWQMNGTAIAEVILQPKTQDTKWEIEYA